jgi:hypothetical protein
MSEVEPARFARYFKRILNAAGTALKSMPYLKIGDGLSATVDEDANAIVLAFDAESSASTSWKLVEGRATSNISINSPPSTIGGVTKAADVRFLLTAQTTANQNGVYYYDAGQSKLVRALDADTESDLKGITVRVRAGSGAGEVWYLSNTGQCRPDVDALTFALKEEATDKGILDGLVSCTWDNIVSAAASADTDINFNAYEIKGIKDPTADQSAATKKYVDDSIASAESAVVNEISAGDGIAVTGTTTNPIVAVDMTSAATPSAVATSASVGSSAIPAKSDHAHALTFTTVNGLLATANATVSIGSQQLSCGDIVTSGIINKSASSALQVGGSNVTSTVLYSTTAVCTGSKSGTTHWTVGPNGSRYLEISNEDQTDVNFGINIQPKAGGLYLHSPTDGYFRCDSGTFIVNMAGATAFLVASDGTYCSANAFRAIPDNSAGTTGSVTLDWSKSQHLEISALTGNVTLTFSGMITGVDYYLTVLQNASAAKTVTFPNTVYFEGGIATTDNIMGITLSTYTEWGFRKLSGGTVICWNYKPNIGPTV